MSSIAKNKKVTLAGKSVEVRKLPIKGIAEMLEAIEKLPAQFNNLAGMSNETALLMLPNLIGSTLPIMAPMISRATEGQVSKEEIMEKADLLELVDFIEAFIEVNNVIEIFRRIKKIKALTQPGARKK